MYAVYDSNFGPFPRGHTKTLEKAKRYFIKRAAEDNREHMLVFKESEIMGKKRWAVTDTDGVPIGSIYER